MVDGVNKGVVDDAWRAARVAVDHSDCFVARCVGQVGLEHVELLAGIAQAGIVLVALDILLCHLVPKVEEYLLELSYGVAFDAGVQVTPFAELRLACDVVVCDIHAARIGHEAVDDHYLAVVAVHHVVHPREAYGVVLIDFDAPFAQAVEMLGTQRTIV